VSVTAARRAWLTDLPVLLVAVVWGSSYLAAKGVTIKPVLRMPGT